MRPQTITVGACRDRDAVTEYPRRQPLPVGTIEADLTAAPGKTRLAVPLHRCLLARRHDRLQPEATAVTTQFSIAQIDAQGPPGVRPGELAHRLRQARVGWRAETEGVDAPTQQIA